MREGLSEPQEKGKQELSKGIIWEREDKNLTGKRNKGNKEQMTTKAKIPEDKRHTAACIPVIPAPCAARLGADPAASAWEQMPGHGSGWEPGSWKGALRMHYQLPGKHRSLGIAWS